MSTFRLKQYLYNSSGYSPEEVLHAGFGYSLAAAREYGRAAGLRAALAHFLDQVPVGGTLLDEDGDYWERIE